MGILFKNVRLWRENNQTWDVLIEGSRISRIGSDISHPGSHIIHGQQNLLVPGFVDLHTHLREPGEEAKETIASGTHAAAKGGYVRVCAMPNTNPCPDTSEKISSILERFREGSLLPVSIVAAATQGREGKKAADILALKEAGAAAVSDDGSGITDPHVLREVLKGCAKAGIPYLSHCEDSRSSHGGIFYDTIPPESEFLPLEQELALSRSSEARYHLCHASTAQAVSLIQKAKGEGLPVTAEVTPHHLALSAQKVQEWTSLYKVNPPIRTEADRQALMDGLITGALDCISTDHAPHTNEEKELPPAQAPFGISGIEIAFPVTFTKLVMAGELSLERLLDSLIIQPRRVLGLPTPDLGLSTNEPADLTLLNMQNFKTVSRETMASKGKNTPFLGARLTGWPILTMVSGAIIWEEGGLQ